MTKVRHDDDMGKTNKKSHSQMDKIIKSADEADHYDIYRTGKRRESFKDRKLGKGRKTADDSESDDERALKRVIDSEDSDDETIKKIARNRRLKDSEDSDDETARKIARNRRLKRSEDSDDETARKIANNRRLKRKQRSNSKSETESDEDVPYG